MFAAIRIDPQCDGSRKPREELTLFFLDLMLGVFLKDRDLGMKLFVLRGPGR